MKEKMNVGVVNMAFATGTESKEGGNFDLYTGVAPFLLLNVNPTLEELQKLYPNRTFDSPPTYEYNKEGEAKGVFITFYMKSNKDHREANEIETIIRASYLIKEEPFMNRDKTKLQIINNYGDTGWVTKEEWANKTLPEYLVKQNFITTGMRPAFVGEESLVSFLKAYISIPNSRIYTQEDGWKPKTGDDLAQAEAGFTVADIKSLIQGDYSSVKNAVKWQPNNQVKFLLGVRTADDGRQFQDVLTRSPIRFAVSDYKRVAKEVEDIQNNGGYPNTEFGSLPFTFQKYEVGATTFTQNSSETEGTEDPFANFAD